jgi:hypothetical protein
MKVITGCAALSAMFTLFVATPAAAAPAMSFAIGAAAPSDVVKVETVRRKHPRRARVDVPVRPGGPGPAPDCPGLTSWNPANPHRGFCDPGFAYRGNVNGCAEDLGYGRWVSCDNRR